MEKTLKELAELTGAEARNAEGVVIKGIGEIQAAKPDEITFLENPKYRRYLKDCKAAAVISRDLPELADKPSLISGDPYLAFAKVTAVFYYGGLAATAGVDKRAVVAADAKLGKGVAVGACAVIGARAEIGDGSVVHALAFVGEDCRLGADCLVYPGAAIRERCRLGDRVIVHPNAVVGSDGFGYAPEAKKWRKIPHAGSVVIEDDVEIGAAVCIDRGVLGDTVIGRGTKLDNLVQIAHNVKVGEDCALAGQFGVAGSTQIGDRVTTGGQVGLGGHLRIGDDVMIGAQSGVPKDVPEKSVVLGAPARPMSEARRIIALIGRLPELFERLQELEGKVGGEEDEKKDD